MTKAILYRRQHYRVRGLVDHRRLDGEVVELEVLESWCAKCGEKFETKSVPGRGGLRRRCDACKAPGRKVRPSTVCKCPACQAKRRRARKALAQKPVPPLARGEGRAAGSLSRKATGPATPPQAAGTPSKPVPFTHP